jgi:hypothetical protein
MMLCLNIALVVVIYVSATLLIVSLVSEYLEGKNE